MPCYSVNTVSLDFQAGDLTLLQKAAAALGLAVRILGDRREIVDRSGNPIATLVKDKATCSQANVAVVNKLRVQYSREIVGHAALKLGWQKVVKTENKLLLRKGSDMKAEMQLTILEDGTISIQTGNMAGEHHASADEFIKLVHQLAGGARETKANREPHHHHHDHHHEHKH